MSEHIEGVIVHLNKGTPKPSRWFAGRIRLFNGDFVNVAGTANIRVTVGMTIEFDGELVNSKYGDQYQPVAGQLIRRRLTTKYEIISFLMSDVFPGIGSKTAQLLYDKYGDKTMPMLEQHLGQVVSECNLNKSQASGLMKGISSTSGMAKLKYAFPHMKQYLLDRIIDASSSDPKILDDIVSRISANPYVALHGDDGFNASLRDADEVALLDLQYDELSKERIDLVVFAALSEFMADKNATYVRIDYDRGFREYSEFFEKYVRAVALAKPLPSYWDGVPFDANCLAMHFQPYWDNIDSFSSCVCSDRRVNPDGSGEFDLYQKKIYLAEKSLSEFMDSAYKDTINATYMKRTVQFIQWYKRMKKEGVYSSTNPDQDQVGAVRMAFGSSMSFISGGPGRGKTATLGFLINAWKHCVGSHILLLAPTGKAVNKLKDATKYVNAETIRRFIYMNRYRKDKKSKHILDMYMEQMPISLDTLVVIDETSMLDFVEANDLLTLINGCTIVFSGDKDQLSPISPGAFLSEMLVSNKINLSMLTRNYRTDVPELGDNADKILNGCQIKDLTITDNFSVIPADERADDETALSPAEKYILNEYADKMLDGADFSDILVVAPFTRSKYGLSAGHLNAVLQEKFNPVDANSYWQYAHDDYGRYIDKRGKPCPALDKSGNAVRIGDRVINNRNNMSVVWHSFKNDKAGLEALLDDPADSAINTGVFNGDMGTIERYYDATDSNGPRILIALDQLSPYNKRRYVWIDCESDNRGVWHLPDWTLGYALSVHKAQGSEARHVIVALSEEGHRAVSWRVMNGSAPFLTRNMLYTAITRAKESVRIIGSLTALQACLDTPYYYCNVRLGEILRNM